MKFGSQESILLIAVAAALVFIVACFVVSELVVRTAKLTDKRARAELRDSYTKTVAQVLGGAAVVLAFAWTIIKDTQTLERDAVRSANQQFVDAAKLMADKSPEARVAGNYAFEKLVTAYPEYYDSVVNSLLAFIAARRPAKEEFDNGIRPAPAGADVGAAIYVIGKLPLRWERLYLRDQYLAGVSFSGLRAFKGAEFLGARLFAANFTWADLTEAKFNGARFEDWVAYGWANNAWGNRMLAARERSDYWWQWEKYRHIANFDNATLVKAGFADMSVAGASFKNADLTGARFNNSDVSRADFAGAKGLLPENFGGACYGREEVSQPPTKPTGLPDAIMSSLRNC